MNQLKIAFTFIMLTVAIESHSQLVFTDLDSFLKYASEKSVTLQSSEIKMDQAKKAKLVAVLGIPDPTGNMSFTYTNNTQLPVTLFPANFTDKTQPEGTYVASRLGLQYNSNLTQTVDIKLFNLQGWQNLRSSKINLQATETDTKLTRKALYENIASTYFNIVQLQEQLEATKENLLANDTILRIAENKLNQGLLKKQDWNDTKISFLNTQENVKQIEFQIQQQYITLKVLADIEEKDSIAIRHVVSVEPSANAPTVVKNELSLLNNLSKEKLAQSTFRKNNYFKIPTISLIGSNTTQQYNTRAGLFDSNWAWYDNTYIGFRLAMPIPSASTITNTWDSKYSYKLAQKNTEHARIKAELDQKQLSTDYSKAWSQFVTNKEVHGLKKDSYQKNLNLFSQGLLSTDQALNSFNTMVNSHYNLIGSVVSLLLAQAKIEINNTIK